MRAFTADQDNARLRPELVAAFRRLAGEPIRWQRAGPKETLLLKGRADLRGLADGVVAVAQGPEFAGWVMQNHWSGFPDPAEFVFVGFSGGGEVSALGYFEDWPAAWARPEGL